MGGKNIMFDCGMHMGFSDEVHEWFCMTCINDVCNFSENFQIFHTSPILVDH